MSGADSFSNEAGAARAALVMSTIAFAACFACWMINGVLVTFLQDGQLIPFSKSLAAWLMGAPVLTGLVMRLPAGLLADRFGGRVVFAGLLLVSALAMWLLSLAGSFPQFLAASFGFGLAGAGFAVGIAYVAAWTPPERMGTALGIFGAGNAGAALMSIAGPLLLSRLTQEGQHPEGWRMLPRLCAAGLVVTAVLFFALTRDRLAAAGGGLSLAQRLRPLGNARVWRFGLYYVAVFGAFVALAQWLIPYYVSAYEMTVARAGLLAACFSLPSAATRLLGGWLSDRFGARSVMYWVFGVMVIGCGLLAIPKMEVEMPGESVLAARAGVVSAVTGQAVVVGETSHPLRRTAPRPGDGGSRMLPVLEFSQRPVVRVGDQVVRRQMLARGTTHVSFAADARVFTVLLFVVGCAMGIGMAAVFKHIPHYFPGAVGVTGGIVGVIGGLGGFVAPLLFGWLLRATGVWTTCWMFLGTFTLGCLVWMHVVIRRMLNENSPELVREFERNRPAPRP